MQHLSLFGAKFLKEKLVPALRSGVYQQTHSRLRRNQPVVDSDVPAGFCCLGVLLDQIDPNGWHNSEGDICWGDDCSTAILPPNVTELLGVDYLGVSKEWVAAAESLGLTRPNGHGTFVPTELNDNQRKTFAEIADVFEKAADLRLAADQRLAAVNNETL